MAHHRLTVSEVSSLAGVSRRSLSRLRAANGSARPRAQTLRRIAEALGELAHLDADEVYDDLLAATGQESEIRQVEMSIRGAAELARHFQAMSPLGRHLLLEQARLLARALPDSD